jgi:hypothetical protein
MSSQDIDATAVVRTIWESSGLAAHLSVNRCLLQLKVKNSKYRRNRS